MSVVTYLLFYKTQYMSSCVYVLSNLRDGDRVRAW